MFSMHPGVLTGVSKPPTHTHTHTYTHTMRKRGKKGKAMKGVKRRAMRKKKAAAPEEAPMKAMRRK